GANSNLGLGRLPLAGLFSPRGCCCKLGACQNVPVTTGPGLCRSRLSSPRALIGHLPKDHRERTTWRYAAAMLEAAALQGDTKDISVALRMVLMLEGIEW